MKHLSNFTEILGCAEQYPTEFLSVSEVLGILCVHSPITETQGLGLGPEGRNWEGSRVRAVAPSLSLEQQACRMKSGCALPSRQTFLN